MTKSDVPEKQTIELANFTHFREFCGTNDRQIKYLREKFKVDVYARNGSIFISGQQDTVLKVSALLVQYNELLDTGQRVDPEDLKYAIKYFMRHDDVSLKDMFSREFRTETARKNIIPRSINQKAYINSLHNTDVVFAIGPAGTGKTYLAMAVAVSNLLRKKTNRIVLTRPAVEAGEKLGFLPGDLNEKISPYLRPLYDAMYEMLGPDKLAAMMEQGEVEVAPLAYMRGRTLNDSYIILDEAQNCTSEQMKMFLTRLGNNSRAVITGDITQIDLPRERRSGLVEIMEILADIEGIDFIKFTHRDVVRHPLVEKIVQAYENHEDAKSGKTPKGIANNND